MGFVDESDTNANNSADFTFTPDFSETQDYVTLPDGTETKVQIKDATIHTSQAGNKSFKITFIATDEPYAKPIIRYLGLPSVVDDKQKKNNKELMLRDFMDAFGLPRDQPFNLSALIGLQAWAILGVESDEKYGDKNTIRKWVKSA